MSHEIETIAYAGDVPWHGLGVPVSNDLSPDEMRVAAGVNWEVYKTPDYIKIPKDWDGSYPRYDYIPSGTWKVCRDDTHEILTSVSDDWQPTLNEDAFNFFDDLVRHGGMEMHTAGSLKSGAIVWVLAKVKDGFTIFGGDTIESYLLFTNPHIYGKAIDIRFTPIRVVCNNTLTMALSGKKADNAVRVSHVAKFDHEQIKEYLGLAHNKLNEYKEMAEFLGSKQTSPEQIINYFSEVFPLTGKKKGEEVKDIAELSRPGRLAFNALFEQPGTEFAEGSWWQPFNASTYVVDHVKGRSADTRLTSAWYGPGQVCKMKALQKAIEYAEVA